MSAGSVIVTHTLSCSGACGIFPGQGSNLCPCNGRRIPIHFATGEVHSHLNFITASKEESPVSLLAAVPTATTSREPLKSSAAFKTRLSQAPPVQSAPSSVLEFPQWLPLPKIHTLPQQLSPSRSVTCAGFLLHWGLQASGGGPHCY